MAVPISELLRQHPTNPVHYTGLTTGTDKKWARDFHPITRLIVHTTLGADRETVYADFDVMATPLADDDARVSRLAYPPNERRWRLETEEDCGVWFHTEVSNIILPAWSDHPIVLQTCQSKPASTTESIKENIDMIHALGDSRLQKLPLVIGEWKRNIIRFNAWQSGNIGPAGPQANLSRELRGSVPPENISISLLKLTIRYLGMHSNIRALTCFALTDNTFSSSNSGPLQGRVLGSVIARSIVGSSRDSTPLGVARCATASTVSSPRVSVGARG
jgi:hypothetical protein